MADKGSKSPPWNRVALDAALLAVAGVAAVIALSGGSNGSSGGYTVPTVAIERPPARPHDPRPNIVVVITDDQDDASMSVMDDVRRMLARRGVSFPNSVTNYSLCCPSRATYVTGQYAHNHGVLDNGPPKGGFRRLDSTNTVPIWMTEAGYGTAYLGKYLNGYGEEDPDGIPPGWATWLTLVAPVTRYFNYTMNENGRLVDYGDRGRDYLSDVITREAVRYIERRRGSPRPFFLTVAYLAPHVGKTFYESKPCNRRGPAPAPRDLGAFHGRRIPRVPSFNERDVSDKPRAIRRTPLLRGKTLEGKTTKYQCRLESLLAVDDGVRRIVHALRATGQLEDTYVIFTSDNGFLQGEHRVKGGKGLLYEESIGVPLIVRGPGLPRDRRARDLVVNADIPASVLDLADARPGLPADGLSLLPAARDPSLDRHRAILIESLEYAGVRTARYVYAEHRTGERELYDLRRDPYELRSRDGDPAYADVETGLAKALDRLRDCRGASCRRSSWPGLTPRRPIRG